MSLNALALFVFVSLTSPLFADEDQPKIVHRILEKIETMKRPLPLEEAFNHLGLEEDDLELEYGETGMGDHDWVYALTADKKWFLNLVWHRTAAENGTLVSYVAIYPGQDYEDQHVKSRRPKPLKPFYRYTFPKSKPESGRSRN